MFGKIVIIEESDLEYNSSLKVSDIGAFAVFFQGEVTVCSSLSHAQGVLHKLEH